MQIVNLSYTKNKPRFFGGVWEYGFSMFFLCA
jgi:hypothetical protein